MRSQSPGLRLGTAREPQLSRTAEIMLSQEMAKSIYDNIARPMRKRSVVIGTLVGVRLQAGQIKAVDAWAAKQEPPVTRPEAIRSMIDAMLQILSKGTGEKPAKKVKSRLSGQKLRARDMAGTAIDRMTDTTAHPDDQASRKHRLLKGPEEFRDVRVDRPKSKAK